MAATGVGTGTTLISSGWTPEVTNISWSVSRPAIDVTDLATADDGLTFIPGNLYESEMTVELLFDSAESPPYDIAAQTATVAFQGGATSWAASGFVKSFEVDVPLEDKMTATAVLRMSGAITQDYTP